jgi:hypothetical protein
LILNQTGPPQEREERARDEALWRAAATAWSPVRDVLALDAFARCWVEEGLLFERAAALLSGEQRALAERLGAAWRRRSLEVFRESMALLGAELARAAADREAIVAGGFGRSRSEAMKALARRFEEGIERLGARWIALHGLEGRAAIELRTALEDYRGARSTVSPERAGIVGGIVSGIAGGLAADVASGGLTLGGGMLLGALIGGFGAAGLARAYTRVRGGRHPELAWSESLLERGAAELLLRYLAVAHAGRGQGAYREREHPRFWRQAVEEALSRRRAELRAAFGDARAAAGAVGVVGALPGAPGVSGAVARTLAALAADATREVLARFYPAAARLLEPLRDQGPVC